MLSTDNCRMRVFTLRSDARRRKYSPLAAPSEYYQVQMRLLLPRVRACTGKAKGQRLLVLLASVVAASCSGAREGELGQACFQSDKCFTGLMCVANNCVCEAESDQELCLRHQASCGQVTTKDRCHGERTIDCGHCVAPEECQVSNAGHTCACTAQTDTEICRTLNANCGSLAHTDRCGRVRNLGCGDCAAPETCGGASVTNQCGCTPEDAPTLCEKVNANCGVLTVTDHCGGSQTINCGTCMTPQTCGGHNEINRCGCQPQSDPTFCQEKGAECGRLSGLDNCEHMRLNIDCGLCAQGQCGGRGKNRCGSDYALISPGSYVRGSPPEELGRDADEGPAHVVSITRTIWVAKTEVTNVEWAQRMMTAPSSFTGCGANCPVDTVNWWEAVSYLNALSISEDLPPCYQLEGCNGQTPVQHLVCSSVQFLGSDCPGYRLPTEGEWEFVARAGTSTPLPTGELTDFSCANPDPGLDSIAWFCGNAAVNYAPCWNSNNDITGSSTCAGTHPVGEKAPNNWGINDMIGNLWEWTSDWYGGYPAASVSNPSGPTQGTTRVVRGCAWSNGARFCRVANRNFYSPDYRFLNVGFRAIRNYSE